jgi:dinuclear metal center YbgI/SA1388 family protein
MLVCDIAELIHTLAPPVLAEPWDNVGLLVGDPRAEAHTCLLALDVDLETIREAKRVGAGLIIAHHPPVFSPLGTVTAADPTGELVLAAARVGVALFAAHTNLDAAPALGTAWALAEHLGLAPGPPLQPAGGSAEGEAGPGGEPPTGFGMVVTVPEMTLEALGTYTRRRLGLAGVTSAGDPQRLVRSVALMPGAGGGCLSEAAAAADALLTGELKYHEVIEAVARGLGVLLAGHYETERPVLNGLARALKGAAGGQLEVAISQLRVAPTTYLAG